MLSALCVLSGEISLVFWFLPLEDFPWVNPAIAAARKGEGVFGGQDLAGVKKAGESTRAGILLKRKG
jgi:hypothetical protein